MLHAMYGLMYHLEFIDVNFLQPQPYKVCGRNPVLAMVNSKSGDNQVTLRVLYTVCVKCVTLCNIA